MDALAKEVRRLEKELAQVYEDYAQIHTAYVTVCQERDIAIAQTRDHASSLTHLTESASSLQLRVKQQDAYIKKVRPCIHHMHDSTCACVRARHKVT